jgi:hypothetical protein
MAVRKKPNTTPPRESEKPDATDIIGKPGTFPGERIGDTNKEHLGKGGQIIGVRIPPNYRKPG